MQVRCAVTLLLLGLLFVPVELAATSRPHGPSPIEEQIDVRALPSLLVEWRWPGPVDVWRLEGDVIYAVGEDRLAAIDVATGEALWDHDLEVDCACSKLEVLPTRIVAGINGRAVLVDRASGALAADVPLGEAITSLVPDPLVIGYRDPLGTHGLVRLDESSGVELARYQSLERISRVDRQGDWLIVQGRGGSDRTTLAGLDLSLTEIWRRELAAESWPTRVGDEIVVRSWADGAPTRWTLDPATGDLRARAVRAETYEDAQEVSVEPLAGGLALVLESAKPAKLIRPSRMAGEPLWAVDLPVTVDASVEWGDQVVLARTPWGGRGVLLVVDTADGRIVAQVAGLRDMDQLRTAGDLLIGDTTKGLAAVRLDEFGPPEAASTTVEAAVKGILADLADPESGLDVYSVQQELESLGAEAMPFLTEAIPEVGLEVLTMIARLVSVAGHRAAAAPLAARAGIVLEAPAAEFEAADLDRESHLEQIAYALAAIANPGQAAMLARLVESEDRLGYARLPAMAALGRLAPELAAAELARLRARHALAGGWLVPPAVEPWLGPAELEVGSAVLEATGSVEASEWRRMMLASQASIAESAAGRWIVFPDAQFETGVLWAASLGDDGLTGPPLFVGAVARPEELEAELPGFSVLTARLDGTVLEVAAAGVEFLAVGIDALGRDDDGDGLTNRLEEFLGLDGRAADSDGDGLDDALDPAPRGGRVPGASEREAAFIALHETLWLSQEAESEPTEPDRGAQPELETEVRHALLVDVPALEWRGGQGATFVSPGCPDDLRPARSYRFSESPPRLLDDDEIAVDMIPTCGTFDASYPAETYVLRSTAGEWVLSGLGW